jgi:hypothetical protein
MIEHSLKSPPSVRSSVVGWLAKASISISLQNVYTSEGSNQSATHHVRTTSHCRQRYQRGPATLQPGRACRYNSAVLRPVSAAHLSGTSSLTADQTKHREPLHYTAASCLVLHHATPAPSRQALSSTIAEPAANQLSQQAHQCQAASPHRRTCNHGLLP